MESLCPEPIRPGQENVGNYPPPAVGQPTTRHDELGGVRIADTRRAVKTLEPSQPPSYYIPPRDTLPVVLVSVPDGNFCKRKGHARYFDVIADGERREWAAWSNPDPTPGFEISRDHVAFYSAAMDACRVDGERVVPQPGSFYGGWITSDIAGPFKNVPRSRLG